MDWQPSETAPRDGSFIVVINVDTKQKNLIRWDFRKSGFFNGLGYKVKFTHWQYFPEFPK